MRAAEENLTCRKIIAFPRYIAKSMVEFIQEEVRLTVQASRVMNDDDIEKKDNIFGLFEKRELQLGKLVGSGGFSDVYEICGFNSNDAIKLNDDNYRQQRQRLNRQKFINENKDNILISGKYVVKHLKVKTMESTKKFVLAAKALAIEAQYLSSLNHENILTLHGWATKGLESYSDGRNDGYFLILDRLEDTLDKKLKQWKSEVLLTKIPSSNNLLLKEGKEGKKSTNTTTTTTLQLITRVQVVRQVASALKYLHSKNIVFRDVKPGNIGFDSTNSVKIFDFGLARELPSKKKYNDGDGCYQMTGLVGTIRYMAPEVVFRKKYNKKIDTYSWAMILWSCLALGRPYPNMNRKTHLRNVCELGQRPSLDDCYCNSSIRSLLEKSWHQNIRSRLTMIEVCQELERIEKDLNTERIDESLSSLEMMEKLRNQTSNSSSIPLPRNTVAPFAA